MWDLTNVLSITNSLLILGVIVFLGSLLLIAFLSGVSTTSTLKNLGNLGLILAFSLAVPLIYGRLNSFHFTTQASKKISVQKKFFSQINPQTYRLVLTTNLKSACYLEYFNPQSKKTSIFFTTDSNQKDLSVRLEHEFLIFESQFSLAQATLICEGNRYPLSNL